MACIYKYKDKLYTKEELVKFLNEEDTFFSPIETHEVKPGIDLLFEEIPELSAIGTQAEYSAYLDTIFPDSKVKTIVYHRTPNKFEKFEKGKYGRGDIHFYKEDSTDIEQFGDNTVSAVINTTNPRVSEVNYDQEEITPDEYDASINEDREYVVFEPNQIHILGSQKDIQGFKEYMKIQNSSEMEYYSPIEEEEPEDADSYFNPTATSASGKVYEYPVGEITSYRALKEQMLSNIDAKLIDVKRELKIHKNRSIERDKLEHAQDELNKERILLDKEVQDLRKEIQKSTFVLHNVVERDLIRANNLAVSSDPKDTQEAQEIAEFIEIMAARTLKESKSFAFGKHPLYTPEEIANLPDTDRKQLEDWARRATDIISIVETSNIAIVENLVNGIPAIDKLYGKKLTIADLTQDMNDIDWLSMFVMDVNNGIFSQNGKLPQVAYYLFNSKMENAQANYRILSDKIDNLSPKVEKVLKSSEMRAELKKLGFDNSFMLVKPADYRVFFQKDTNGLFGKGMNLVDFLSSEYYAAKAKRNEEYNEKYALISAEKDAGKKQSMYDNLIKDKMKNIRKHEHVINPAMLSVFRNDPKYGHDVFKPYISLYTQDQVNEHEKLLLDLLGQKEYDKQIARMKTLLDDYIDLRESTINEAMAKEGVTHYSQIKNQKSISEINELSLKENPYYAARLTETGNKPQQKDTIYGKRDILPNISNVLSIPKKTEHYDKQYKLIQSNDTLAEFYNLSREIAETMKAVFPSDIQAKILDTSLNHIPNTVWHILLQDEGGPMTKLIKILRKMGHSLLEAFGSDSNPTTSYAHLNWKTNEANYEVNASFLTNNLREIKAIKALEIAKFQSLSGLSDLKKVDTNVLDPSSRKYLERILGKGALEQPRVINVYKLLDSYAHHQKMQDSSPNLPKILKAYSNVASQYQARTEILPIILNIKNHFNDIKSLSQNKFGNNVLVNQVALNKLSGKRVKAVTQFESWFNRQVLDNKEVQGQFAKLDKKEIINLAEKLRRISSGIRQGIPLTSLTGRIHSAAESKNIKEIGRILKTIPDSKIEKLKNLQSIAASLRTESQQKYLDANMGILNMLEYIEESGKTFSGSSFLSAIVKYTGLKALALNLSSAATNLIEGQISNVLAAEVGDAFKPEHLNSVSPVDIMYARLIGRTTGLAGKKFSDGKTPIRVWKLDKLIDRYDIFADIANDVQHSSTQNMFEGFTSNTLLSPTRITEYYNQAPFIGAVLAGVMVKGKDAQGNDIETDLLDAIDRFRTPSGYILVMKPEYNTDENRAAYLRDFSGMTKQDAIQYSKKYVDLKVKIDQGIKNAHGDYHKFSGMYAKEFVVGKALLSLRTWLPRQLYIRFAPEQDDLLLGVKGFKGFARSHITPTAMLAGGLTGMVLGGLTGLGGGMALGLVVNNVFGKGGKSWGAYSGTHWLNDLAITTQMLFYKLIGSPLNLAYLFVRPAVNYVSGKKTRRIVNTTANKVVVYDDGFKVRDAYTMMQGDRFSERDYKNFKANIRDIANMLTIYAIYFAVKLMYKPDDDDDTQGMTEEEKAKLKKEKSEENLLVNKALQLVSQMTSYYNLLDLVGMVNPLDTAPVRTLENVVKFVSAASVKIFGEDWQDVQVGGVNQGKSKFQVELNRTFIPSSFADPTNVGFSAAMTHQWLHTSMDEWFKSANEKAEKELRARRIMLTEQLRKQVKSEKQIKKEVKYKVPYKDEDETYQETLEKAKQRLNAPTGGSGSGGGKGINVKVPNIKDVKIPNIRIPNIPKK